eukprot:CAMPEP_0194332650 /NCGR_PEP_ID=MMETSP0171-20130528/59877_1 /TAXON_ID=218684 /ORGANISM="Corethron pennatum, Strain L29A3" /LENGTH=93 /DNA_ID=CAMNT_0039094595 /DNA_START=843 /DNA_END=1124 /DNA_ORIENTATION=+
MNLVRLSSFPAVIGENWEEGVVRKKEEGEEGDKGNLIFSVSTPEVADNEGAGIVIFPVSTSKVADNEGTEIVDLIEKTANESAITIGIFHKLF